MAYELYENFHHTKISRYTVIITHVLNMQSSIINHALFVAIGCRPVNRSMNSCPQISMVSFSHSRTSCNKTEFGMDYVPFLCSKLTKPLIDEVCWGTHCCVISGSPLWKMMDSSAICMSCI